jgi:hypothetical protein
MKLFLLLLVYFLLFPIMLFAQIYKWEDNRGVIHFFDNPPTADTKESAKETNERVSIQPVSSAIKATELVKNHPTLPGPETGKFRSVEKRMIDAKQSFFLNMTWRYESKTIGRDQYRVTQYVENGIGESFIRTWIVDVSSNKVSPENMAAKKLYY